MPPTNLLLVSLNAPNHREPATLGLRQRMSSRSSRALNLTAAYLKYASRSGGLQPRRRAGERLERRALSARLPNRLHVHHPYPFSLDGLFEAMSPYCEGR